MPTWISPTDHRSSVVSRGIIETMEDRKKSAPAKSGPIDLLKNLTSSASKEKRSTAAAGSNPSPQTSSSNAGDNDRRPLQTYPLSPPDYLIAPEILMESFVELPVLFSLSSPPPPSFILLTCVLTWRSVCWSVHSWVGYAVVQFHKIMCASLKVMVPEGVHTV